MALIDVQCQSCGATDEVYRAITDWPKTPPCGTCHGPTDQIFPPPGGDRLTPTAVVVYQAPDGTFRFPGRTDGASTAKYDQLGYTRVEARGWAEVRRLESKMNAVEYAKACRLAERRQALREEGERLRRSESTHRMRTMSDGGRLFGQALRRYLDSKDRRPKTPDPGIHVAAYSNDRSHV